MNIIQIVWVLGAGVFGFAVAALFGGALRLPRRWYLLPYVLAVGGFLGAYALNTGLNVPGLLLRNPVWGVVGGVLVGAFLVRNVLSQPASEGGSGLDVLWAGLVYGVFDALLLSVMPTAAMWAAFGMGSGPLARIGVGALALIASVYVTAAYHLGYPEFRGRSVWLAVMGNAIITLGLLLTGSPLAAILSHTAMHVAAVLHGPETAIQLPPHYGEERVAA
jgi:hypothetical protein